MRYCDIKNPPVFTTEIDKWDKTTRDNGEELAVPIEDLANNTVYNKAEIEKLKGKTLTGITIPVADWNGLTYTISAPDIKPSSRVTIAYAFDSVPVAQKANIRGRLEAGELILVATKLPTASIVVEEISIVNL